MRTRTALTHLVVATFVLLVLSGCGGGGDTAAANPVPAAPGEPVQNAPAPAIGTLKQEVIALPEEGWGRDITLTLGENGGAELSSSAPAVSQLKVGQLVHVPMNAAASPVLGFTGRVHSTSIQGGISTVRLEPASPEDVFSQLNWDMDTAGAVVVGVVDVTGAQVKFTMSTPQPMKSGAVAVTPSGLTGNLSFAREFDYQGRKLQLTASIDLENVKVRSKGELDPTKYPGGGGWGRIGVNVSGSVGAKVALSGVDGLDIPIGDMLYSADAWKDLKWNAGRLFALEGLGAEDKAGRIAIGGVVITPIGAASFKGSGVANERTMQLLSKAMATVLWIYVDVNGNMSIEGESGVEIGKFSFDIGREFVLRGAGFDLSRVDNMDLGRVALYGEGKLKATQKVGISLAADVLIGGIRPANLSIFTGSKRSGTFQGAKLSMELYPEFGKFAGAWACYDESLGRAIEAELSLRAKVQFGTNVFADNSHFGFLNGDGVRVETKWSGKLHDFGTTEWQRNWDAVCAGRLAQTSTSVLVGGTQRVLVVREDGMPLRDFSGKELTLPTRLQFKFERPELAEMAVDGTALLVKGKAAGLTQVTIRDPLTGWETKGNIVVGETLTRANNRWLSPNMSIKGWLEGPSNGSYELLSDTTLGRLTLDDPVTGQFTYTIGAVDYGRAETLIEQINYRAIPATGGTATTGTLTLRINDQVAMGYGFQGTWRVDVLAGPFKGEQYDVEFLPTYTDPTFGTHAGGPARYTNLRTRAITDGSWYTSRINFLQSYTISFGLPPWGFQQGGLEGSDNIGMRLPIGIGTASSQLQINSPAELLKFRKIR